MLRITAASLIYLTLVYRVNDKPRIIFHREDNFPTPIQSLLEFYSSSNMIRVRENYSISRDKMIKFIAKVDGKYTITYGKKVVPSSDGSKFMIRSISGLVFENDMDLLAYCYVVDESDLTLKYPTWW